MIVHIDFNELKKACYYEVGVIDKYCSKTRTLEKQDRCNPQNCPIIDRTREDDLK